MLATGGKLLIASEKGLDIYRGGSFPQIPISYWQGPDWNASLRWTDGREVQWRATPAKGCDGANVELRLLNNLADELCRARVIGHRRPSVGSARRSRTAAS